MRSSLYLQMFLHISDFSLPSKKWEGQACCLGWEGRWCAVRLRLSSCECRGEEKLTGLVPSVVGRSGSWRSCQLSVQRVAELSSPLRYERLEPEWNHPRVPSESLFFGALSGLDPRAASWIRCCSV